MEIEFAIDLEMYRSCKELGSSRISRLKRKEEEEIKTALPTALPTCRFLSRLCMQHIVWHLSAT